MNKPHACRNPLCNRLTTAEYCCGPCCQAHTDHYEIHPDGPLAHTPNCDARHQARGPEPGRGDRVRHGVE